MDTAQGRMLVLAGSAVDHAQLAGIFRALSQSESKTPISLGQIGLLSENSDTAISIIGSNASRGGLALTDSEALWRLSADRMIDFAELLLVLAVTDGPGHQYLDADNDAMIVKASKDEYPLLPGP
ncbi:MAG: hypothetical protein J0I57_08470 [Hyphomicrobium sp.]|nr:hypothetical protein [Hyphomicrobium sp.]